jgi:hypothetical protein
MSAGLDESALLIAFARAAFKAQKIEALFHDLLIASEVAQDQRNRSLEEIAAQIESETLGQLKSRFLQIVQKTVGDPRHAQMWKEINEERIFLMHKFFNVFPVPAPSADKIQEGAERLGKIDALLNLGCSMLEEVRERAFASLKISPERMRKFLAFVVESRKQDCSGK